MTFIDLTGRTPPGAVHESKPACAFLNDMGDFVSIGGLGDVLYYQSGLDLIDGTDVQDACRAVIPPGFFHD
jgi:hypothetical protein